MKKFIKLVILVLAVLVMTLSVACTKKEDDTKYIGGKSDWDAIVKKGEIVVGYTVYAPIAYPDAENKLIGFDVELPKALASYYNISVKFQEIDWDTKEAELSSGTIDVIWNGLTITDDRKDSMSITIPYMKNQQVVVIRKADEATYTSIASLANAKLCAEAGSAGEDAIKDNSIGKSYTGLNGQVDILTELRSKTSDAGVMDSVMANYYLSLSAEPDLAIVSAIALETEYFGIAARQASPYVAAMISNGLIALSKNGTVATIATKYGLTDVVSIDETATVSLLKA